MGTKLTYLLSLSSLLILGSCATSNQTAQQIDQNDDVYYSEAKAKEKAEVIAQAKPEASRNSDYVTDEELYRDGYGATYSGDYAQRINRFRNYTPWRGYYSNVYGNVYSNMYSYYDPFYNPYSFYGGPGINLAIGINGGYYNYNPWRYYGYNYSNNFWGPYSYYNQYGIGYGNGFYGNSGYYGNYGYGGNRPVYTSPNYRPRPIRSSDGLPIDPGAVRGGNAGGVIRNGNNGNGNIVPSDGSRSGRYNGGNSTTPSTSGTSRPQTTAPRPERVSQSQPQRTTQPERVNTAPPSNNNSGGGRSNDSGGSSSGSGGGRPSRGN